MTETEILRAITLTQPWCGMMATGIKLIENRTRPMIKRDHIGKPIALHASRQVDDRIYGRIHEIAPELPSHWERDREPEWYRLSRLTSAVIAVATLADIIDLGPIVSGLPPEDAYLDKAFAQAVARGTVDPGQRRWYFQRVGYVLRDVVALPEPVPCRGWQGFWTMATNEGAAVRYQLEAA